MKQLFIILSFSCVLVGYGDKYTYYSTYIDNQTTDTVKFYWQGQTKYMQGNLDSLICLPNSNTIYINTLGRYAGWAVEYKCESKMNKDEVRVVINSGKTLVKEIWDSNNWICIGSNEEGWKTSFIITEEDLE